MSETFEDHLTRLRHLADPAHSYLSEEDRIPLGALLERYHALQTPCRCDPPGSGEEWCNGACLRAELLRENEALRQERNRAGVELRRAVAAERAACAERLEQRVAALRGCARQCPPMRGHFEAQAEAVEIAAVLVRAGDGREAQEGGPTG